MPIVVFVLAAAVFAQGTSEFMVSGLLELIAADVGVSLGAAGLLTSLFAGGMVAGAPVMAMVTERLSVRYSVTAFLGLFCVAHVVGAVTDEFAVLLVTRVVAAVANAGFLAVVLAALPGLVGSAMVGRATSVVVSGVTVACIAGVPAGALLGQVWGWRSAFWAVAILSAAALAPVWMMLGHVVRQSDSPGQPVRREWLVLRQRAVLIPVVAGILVNAATFAGFTYLGTITNGIAGGDRWVPVVLALFGIGSFLGVMVIGRFGDDHQPRIIRTGTITLTGVWMLAAVLAHTLIGVSVLSIVLGAFAFGVGSTLIATIVRTAAPVAPRIAGALATTALNIGAVLGPVAAGPLVDRTGHPTTALWCGAAFTAVAAGVALLGHQRRDSRPAERVRADRSI
ncbi:Cmx/CmrA family chloramphenicol efflux MFS transporter [Nocardia sp. NPDC052001]|uniref:Cmx/CmrA family chloramphenicol efflux MFS transporter n=1 Tax=Nocardia sp. NPDC052001 TaxID=3154853 RepID=UPI003443946C